MRIISRTILAALLACGAMFAATATTTTLNTSGNATLGKSVTLTASVVQQGSSTAVTAGSVTFFNGVNVLGIGTVNASGQATLSSSTLPPGVASLTALYQGNSSFSPSASGKTLITISAATGGKLGAANVFNAVSFPDAVLSSDFDGDGNPDLAILNQQGPNVTVLLGDGHGKFTPMTGSPFLVGLNPSAMAISDFNGDGKPDIVVANQGSGNVSVLLSNGSGSFLGAAAYAVPSAYAVTIADFNGDGLADLAVTENTSPGKVGILLGNGTGSFGTVTPVSGPNFGVAIAAGDFNGDGLADLSVLNDSGSVAILAGNGNGGFASPASISLGSVSFADSIAVGDLNGDGKLDIATANFGSANVSVLLGNGDDTFTAMTGSPFTVGTKPKGIAIGDINGDGILDLATANLTGNNVSVLIGTGTTFSAQTAYTFPPSGSPGGITIGDFNGDGISDVAEVGSATGGPLTFDGNVGILFGATPASPTPTAIYVAADSPSTTYGQAVVLTATIYNTASVGDTVTFYSNGVSLGTATITTAGSPTTVSLTTTAIGFTSTNGANITATYNGGSAYGPSTTLYPVQHNVIKASATTSLSVTPTTVGTTQPLTLTATVTTGATGSVAFYRNGSTPLGTAAVSGGNPNKAILNYTGGLPSGSVPLTAVYLGDANFLSSPASNSVTETVIPGTVTTLTSSANPTTLNQPITLTATVKANSTLISSTALVTFYQGATVIGTGAITNGVATLQTSYPTVGYYALTASFPGDANYGGSTSAVLTETVHGSATTVTLSGVTPASPVYGQQVTLTATVTSGPSSAPYGLVDFFDSGALLGSAPVTSAGTASLTTTRIGPGARRLRALYSGAQTSGGSVSAVVAKTVVTIHQSGFKTPVTYPASPATFPNATAVAVADFNGDGKDDIAAVTSATGANGVEVLFGNGDGTFQPAIFYATTGSPGTSMAAGDFNADGAPDLAVVTGVGIEVLMNSGHGSFGSAIPTSGAYVSVSIGDLNTDGMPDLLVGGSASSYTLIGNGDGTFGTPAAVAGTTLNGNVFTTVTDLNNDGLSDLVILDAHGNLNLALGNGDGTFGTPTKSTNSGLPTAVSAGDFNGDGNIDIVWSNASIFTSPGQVTLYFGNGAGGVTTGNVFTTANQPGVLVVGDFNSDGALDVAVTDSPDSRVIVLYNNGSGLLVGNTNFNVAGTPTAIAAGNFTGGDGRGSLVVGFGSAGNIQVLAGSAPVPTVSCFALAPLYNTGSGFSNTCTAANGIGPYTYSIGSGSFPPGTPPFTINTATGVISGTPTSAGTYTYTIQATDSDTPPQIGVSSTQTLVIQVPLSIINANLLPVATVGVDYGQVAVVTGGTGPYSCTVNSGAPPNGMTFTPAGCLLSGTPTDTLGGSLNIRVADSKSNSVSGSVFVTITGLPSSVALTQTAGTNPTTFGTAASITATVTPSTATGFVQFYNGSTLLRTVTVSSGTAVFSIAGQAAGVYSITGQFTTTDNLHAGSTSTPFAFTITKSTPTVTLSTSAPVPPLPGGSITFTAKTGATGTVTFFDGATQLGTPVTIASNAATLTTTALTAGTHVITATYNGDANRNTATSANLNQGVFNNIFSDTFTPAASSSWLNEVGNWSALDGVYDAASPQKSPTNAHSLLPNVLGDFSVHFTTSAINGDGGVWLRATDAAGTGIGISGMLFEIQPSSGTAFFSVVQNGVYSDKTSVALTAAAHAFDIVVIGNVYSVYLDGNTSKALLSGSNATFTSGQVGLYENVALGFGNFSLNAASATPSPTLISTTTTFSATPNPVTTGQSVTLQATVTPASGTVTPTGTVMFIEGAASIGSGTLDGSGVATFATSSLSAATHSITASYGGDSSFSASTSSAGSVIVNAAVPVNPTITTSTLSNGQVGQVYSTTLAASGGSGGYSWSGTAPAGLTINSNGTITGTPTAAGTFSVSVTVTAGAGSANATLSLVVAPATLTISTSTLSNAQVGQAYSATLVAAGGAGSYSWSGTAPAGLTVNANGTITGTPTTAGTFSVSVTVAAGAASANATLSLIVTSAANPTITTTSLSNGQVGQAYSATLAATGGTGGYTWSGTAPAGLTVNSNGTITGTPTTAGTFTADLMVTAGAGSGNASLSLVIAPAPSLTINTTILSAGQVGQAYLATLSASGGTGASTWSGSAPAGLTVNPNGTITGTPTAAGTFSVSLTVTAGSASANATLSLLINPAVSPLALNGSSNLGDIPVGGSISVSFSAAGGIPPYQWSLPAGSSLSVDASGNVRGTASQAGNFSTQLTVTDSANGSASLSLSLSVLGLSGSLSSGSTTAAYSGSILAVGGVGPYTYSASGLPKGIIFAAGTLTGQAVNAGSYTVSVRVTDSQGVAASGTYPITITGPAPVTLTLLTSSLQDAYLTQPYSQTLSAGGGTPGYTWALSGGQLPPGLGLSSSGTVSGVPTTAGPFTFGVQLTDTAGAHVNGSVTLNAQPAPLQITSSAAFPTGMAGIAYPLQILTANGGIAPYTFAVTAGSLPAGLTLTDSIISGTPTTTGNFAFTLRVTDSEATPATATQDVTGQIESAFADLVLPVASASFSLASGTNTIPTPVTIPVSSAIASQALSYTATASVPWLTVGGSNGTPGTVSISLNNAALSQSAAGSPYSGVVQIVCTSDPCTGRAKSVAVTLTVTALSPRLSVGTPLLSFSALASSPQASTVPLSISNTGGGSLAVSAVTAGATWLSVGSVPAAVAPGSPASVTITANPTGLQPGYYTTALSVTSSAGNASIPVTLLISGASTMTLGPAGAQFAMTQGGAPGNSSGSFLVSVSSGTASYSATVQPGATWLSGGGSGTASPNTPGTVGYSINAAAAASLAPGSYYGTIRVVSSGVVNSPLDYQVILTVAQTGAAPAPDPEPAGLVFLTTSGATATPQTVMVYVGSIAPLTYQVATDGSQWLSISGAAGQASSATPGQIAVTVTPGSMKTGVYAGAINVSLGGASMRSVNVTMIVQPALSASLRGGGIHGDAAAPKCSGPVLAPTETGLASNFSVAAGWPSPLNIVLYDSCGSPVTDAQITATFSNGDPALTLSLVNPATGTYSGTWTPRTASPNLTITFTASDGGYSPVSTTISGQVTPNAVPVLAANGISDIFNSQVGAALAPGGIVQIYGGSLASVTSAPTAFPLPTSLYGTSVQIGGLNAPLYYASPGQINAQVPFELTSGGSYQVVISQSGALSTPQTIQLISGAPAVLQDASGTVIAQHQDGSLITATAPAVRGEYVVIYLTGMGPTTASVASGAASPSNPPATVTSQPTLSLNGLSIPVAFAGLTPTLAGLYQINFQVPQTLASGTYNLAVSQNGVASNTSVLTVK